MNVNIDKQTKAPAPDTIQEKGVPMDVAGGALAYAGGRLLYDAAVDQINKLKQPPPPPPEQQPPPPPPELSE